MQKYELPELTDKSCLCPHCDEIGAVVAEDDRLGNIYECLYCVQEMEFPAGVLNIRFLTWAIVNGAKHEVLG